MASAVSNSESASWRAARFLFDAVDFPFFGTNGLVTRRLGTGAFSRIGPAATRVAALFVLVLFLATGFVEPTGTFSGTSVAGTTAAAAGTGSVDCKTANRLLLVRAPTVLISEKNLSFVLTRANLVRSTV